MLRPTSEETKQQWKETILKQRQSGLSIASWCRQNNIVIPTFYYWQDKLFPKPLFDRSAFVEIPSKKGSREGITLEYEGFKIHLSQQFNPSLLVKCLEVLKKCS